MNRYPLNSQVLGAGSQVPLTLATAVQNMVLAVAAASRVIRGMRADSVLQLSSVGNYRVRRIFKAVESLALSSNIKLTTWYQKYLSATSTLSLNASITVHQWIKRYVLASVTLGLASRVSVRHLIRTYASAVQNFAMATTSKYSRRVLLITLQQMGLGLSLRSLHKKSFKAAQIVAVNGVVKARTALRGIADQMLQLLFKDTAHHWVYNPVVLQQSLAMQAEITAYDITTTEANIERTVSVNSDPRLIIVPGESYESGV